jgi:hypothetical protein
MFSPSVHQLQLANPPVIVPSLAFVSRTTSDQTTGMAKFTGVITDHRVCNGQVRLIMSLLLAFLGLRLKLQ